MKKVLLMLLATINVVLATAQNKKNVSDTSIKATNSGLPVCYIGFGMGTNNPCGIIGLDFGIVLKPHITLDAGAGTSTWGNKLYVGAKYYLRAPQRGWALGGGLTFNSGNENVKTRARTVAGTREVTLVFKPQTNIYVGISRYWTIGRKYNRFFAEVGYSVPITTPHYEQIYGPRMQDRADRFIKLLSPGGIMAGLGFSFALYNRHSS